MLAPGNTSLELPLNTIPGSSLVVCPETIRAKKKKITGRNGFIKRCFLFKRTSAYLVTPFMDLNIDVELIINCSRCTKNIK